MFFRISFSPSPCANTLKAVTTSTFPCFLIILLTVLSLKYSGNVVSFFELAILATFFAGSIPMAFIPRFFNGSRNIPSLLPISTTTDVFFSFKSVFNSLAISTKWSLNC